MIEMDRTKVCYIAIKAREYFAHDDGPLVTDAPAERGETAREADDASNPSDDGFREILEGQPDDPTEDELSQAIANLNVDEQCELVALAWVGRGDFASEEWGDALATARERHNGDTAGYLLGMPLLADYLQDGLSQFDLSCEDVEIGHL